MKGVHGSIRRPSPDSSLLGDSNSHVSINVGGSPIATSTELVHSDSYGSLSAAISSVLGTDVIEDENIDEDLVDNDDATTTILDAALRSACKVHGVVAAEVWVTSSSRSASLRRARGGWFVEPSFERRVMGRPETLTAVGLRTLAAKDDDEVGRRAVLATSRGMGLAGVLLERNQERGLLGFASWARPSDVEWCGIQQMVDNPELPTDERTAAASVVFDSCAGVALTRPGGGGDALGVLVLFASADADPQVLRARASSQLVECVASAVGAAVLLAPRCKAARALVPAAPRHVSANVLRATRKLRALVKTGWLVGVLASRSQDGAFDEALAATRTRNLSRYGVVDAIPDYMAPEVTYADSYFRKLRGAPDAEPPPLLRGMPWSQVALTWVGCALTLLLLSRANEAVKALSDDRLSVLLGSYGALLTLLFSAHNSPVVQPRNVIGGSVLSASIAVAFGAAAGGAGGANFALLDGAPLLPHWAAIVLAPATAIAAMAKLGLTHPPGGAIALIFVTAKPEITEMGWLYVLVPVLSGSAVCCCVAAVINNLSSHRQYPLYWN